MRIKRNFLLLLIASMALAAPAFAQAPASGKASDCKVGSYVKFGRYPQSNAKTPEPIEWKVLDNDGKTVLLISRYGLDCKPFHNVDASVTWRDCDLREWLNTHFISQAFTKAERQRISETIDTESADSAVKGSSAARDEVFLLSMDEAVKYLIRGAGDSLDWDEDILKTHDFALSCRPTAYAVSRGVKTVANSKEFRNSLGISSQAQEPWFGNCCYWLRSINPGSDDEVLYIFSNGRLTAVDHVRSLDNYIAVRPALRLKLNGSQNNEAAQDASPGTGDEQQDLQEGEILIPAGIYNNSSAYDSLAPYAAYESGKKALEEQNPNGYAMLASSARRGCNQARMYLAKIFMPADSPLNGTNISIVLEGKELRLIERLERYEQYMRQAADNNSLTAAKALVALYGGDKYIPKNPELVFKYTKSGALQKDPASMYKLGYLYSKGQGCQKDRAAAVKWMKDAAHAGSRDAKQWIEDRRGHYVEEQVLASTSRRSYSEMLAEVGDSSSSFDSFAKGLYRTYGGYSGYKDLIKVHAARYTITPTTFHRYFSEYDDGIYNICGIVAMEPYYNCTVLTDGNRSVVVYCPNLPAGSRGFAVKMLVYGGKASSLSGGRTSLYSPGISDSADAVGRNYRTVKKWQGPKIGGWEDLLK
ncbi:MAG: sel1 repeat family protein [bacterium]|nr:sel1 repeat family protein [bacterium]